MTTPRLVVVHPDATLLARGAAVRLLTHLLDLQSVQSTTHLVLTGGTVGIATLRAVAEEPLRDAVDWSGVHLWWGDERFLPDGDPDRNEVQAHEALIDGLVASGALPAENVHVMPSATAVGTVEDSAAAYADEIAELRARFDLVLLGMGPDGHVASLFPHHRELDVTGVPTVGVHDSPKPPPDRVSLTFDAIRSGRQVWIIAAGAEKADAVRSALEGADVHDTPAVAAEGAQRTLWLVDTAAAGERAAQA